jgi:hypothetical protein
MHCLRKDHCQQPVGVWHKSGKFVLEYRCGWCGEVCTDAWGDEMNTPPRSEHVPWVRELTDEEVLILNRAVLQVMFERNIAAGALDDAIDDERVIWENRS